MKKLIFTVIAMIAISAASAQQASTFKATALGVKCYARNVLTYSFQYGWTLNVTKATVMVAYDDVYGSHIVNAILDYNNPNIAGTNAIVAGTQLMISVRPQNFAPFGYTDGNVGAAADDIDNCLSGQVISIIR